MYLGTVTDGVHGRVLHHNALEPDQEHLEGLDYSTQIGLCQNGSDRSLIYI